MTTPISPVVPHIIWPGSGSDPSGKTAFGIFDFDNDFVEDAPKVAKWVCSSLGYPVVDIELTDSMIYIQLESAIIEFSTQVNEFNMREYMLNLQGTSTGSSVTQKLIKGTPLPMVVEMAVAYGVEAGTGGNVNYKKTSINLINGQQEYDLQALVGNVSESGNRIEIRRVWHERIPALSRFFDPFAGGLGMENGLQEFGWGSFSVASQFLLMPIFETILRGQAIEFNDTIRRSQYSFEIKNNKIKLFPMPKESEKLWFEYTVALDKFSATIGNPGTSGSYGGGIVSDISNVPYDTIPYQYINDGGKRWIWRYALALCKEVLGNTRSKYALLPIPNADVSMDGLTLRQEGQAEKEKLIQTLRETLERAGKHSQLEAMEDNETATLNILSKVPNLIYVG